MNKMTKYVGHETARLTIHRLHWGRTAAFVVINFCESFLDKALSIFTWVNYIQEKAKLTRKPENTVLQRSRFEIYT